MIYAYTIELQPKDQFEYVGNCSRILRTDLCLPLHKVRPPSLGRVCTTTRNEYLPYNFTSTCLRVYINVEVVCPFFSGIPNAACTYLDPATREMFDSISDWNGFRFRNVEYRFVNNEGEPVGASFSFAYAPRKRTYEIDLKIDDGWYVAGTLRDPGGLGHEVTRFSTQILNYYFESSTDKGLDWPTSVRLHETFDLIRNFN